MILENNVCIVAGASSGIGRATATTFVTQDARVAVGYAGDSAPAAMCALLASDAASYTTISTFFIDGGVIRRSGSL